MQIISFLATPISFLLSIKWIPPGCNKQLNKDFGTKNVKLEIFLLIFICFYYSTSLVVGLGIHDRLNPNTGDPTDYTSDIGFAVIFHN